MQSEDSATNKDELVELVVGGISYSVSTADIFRNTPKASS